jgi:hypothetical protein
MPPSSSGLGRHVLNVKIAGSTPAGGTQDISTTDRMIHDLKDQYDPRSAKGSIF